MLYRKDRSAILGVTHINYCIKIKIKHLKKKNDSTLRKLLDALGLPVVDFSALNCKFKKGGITIKIF